MIATALCWIFGLLLISVSIDYRMFHRVVGKTIKEQHKFSQQIPSPVRQSQDAFEQTMRVIVLVAGLLLLAVGVAALVTAS